MPCFASRGYSLVPNMQVFCSPSSSYTRSTASTCRGLQNVISPKLTASSSIHVVVFVVVSGLEFVAQ